MSSDENVLIGQYIGMMKELTELSKPLAVWFGFEGKIKKIL